ncbi:aminotransferase class V-fold PLP-dependent enzyme [Sciscionella marina]|uniref:aminotransferase class V-fold PLP-dependent enzyme n=1 Tax=Sciscionella marina TaxID=508770 RepID=UPI000361C9C5|nr:aminotransferase class V-fold PLP-dependent enzyme [Sciscionella marina]
MRRCFGQEFDVPLGYCNTTSIGIPPRSAAVTAHEVIDTWASGGYSAPDFDAPVATARSAFAGLAGVPADSVAIGSSVAELVATVAASLGEGTRVLVAEGEFTSTTFPFAAQAHRGITVTETAWDRLLSEVDGHDLVAVSLVQSADGRILELDSLREAVERAGARLLLDVTQAAGWLPLHLDWADYVVGAGYKWLMCPRGVAWLAVREPERLHPVHANWYAGEAPWETVYGLPLRLAGNARRFDLSPVWFSQAGAAAVLPWLSGLDMHAVAEYNIGLANALRAGLGMAPGNTAVVSADLGERAEGLRAAGIRAAIRAGRSRFAFHLYNTEEDVAAVLDAVARPIR